MTRCDIKIQTLVIDVLTLCMDGVKENFNKISAQQGYHTIS